MATDVQDPWDAIQAARVKAPVAVDPWDAIQKARQVASAPTQSDIEGAAQARASSPSTPEFIKQYRAKGGNIYGQPADTTPKPEGYYLTHAPPPEMIGRELGEAGIAAANAPARAAQGILTTADTVLPYAGFRAAARAIPTIPDIPGTEGGPGQEIGGGLGDIGLLAATGGIAGTGKAAVLAGLESFGAHYHSLKADGADETGAVLGALAGSGLDAAAIKLPLDRLAAKTEGGLGAVITNGYVFGGVSGAQTALSDAITAAATPKDMGSLLDWIGRAGESSLKGGLAGLFVGAIHSAFAAMPAKEQAKALANLPESPESSTDRAPVDEPLAPISEPGTPSAETVPLETTPAAEPESSATVAQPESGTVAPKEVTAKPVASEVAQQEPQQPTKPPPASPEPASGETKATGPSPTPKPGDVSIKNAKMDADLAELGLTPRESGEQSNADTVERGSKIDGKALIDDLIAKPRAIGAEEGAALLHERNTLRLELDAARKARDAGTESTERIEKAKADLAKLAEAARAAGEHTGRSLQFRKAFMAEDYSYAGIEARLADAKGEALSETESKEAEAMAKEYAEADKAAETARETADREHRLSELERKVAEMERDFQKPARARSHRRKAQEARADIDKMFRELATTAHQLGPQQIVTLTKLAAAHIRLGYHSFAEWAATVREQIGDKADAHLEAAWAQAQKERRGEVTERMKQRVAEGSKPAELGRYVDQITRRVVESGIKDREAVVDAVHESLKEVFPKMTRAEAEDAISGYGQFRPLKQDPVSVTVRDIRGQLQQIGKLRDLEAKQPPKKTGPERREPSPTERRLAKKVRETYKALGIKVTDPASQLKSALASRETHTENRIRDLRHEIDLRELSADTTGEAPTSPKLEALKAELARTLKEHEAIFGKKGASDEQKAAAALKATEASLAEYERRLTTGDLSKPPEKQGPPTEETARLDRERAVVAKKRDAARAELDALRAMAEPQVERKSPQETALEKRLAEVEERIKTGNTEPKPEKQGPPSEAVARLKAKLEEGNRQLAQMRADKNPRTSQSVREETRLSKQVDALQKRLNQHDLAAQKRAKQGPDVEPVARLKEQRDALNKRLDQLRSAERERTPLSVRQEAQIRKQIDDLSARIERGEIAAKSREKQGPDPEGLATAKAERAALQKQLDELRKAERPSAEARDVERLEKQRAELQARLESGDLSPKQTGRATVDTAAVAEARAKVKALTEQIAEARKAATPRRTPAEIARDNYLALKARQLAHAHERLQYEDFAPRDKKAPRELSKAETEAQVAVQKVKEKIAIGERRYQREQWSTVHKRLDDARQILGTFADVLTSMDLPPLLRQGGVFTLTHPITSIKAFGKSLPAIVSGENVKGALHGDWSGFMSDAGARRIQAAVEAHPDFERLKAAGVSFTGYGDTLSPQEENIRSLISQSIPGVAHTQRGFPAFMNLQRVLVGSELLARAQGGNAAENAKSIARYVNDATGRGKFKNPKLDAGLELARMGLFAPRLYLSRLNILTGSAMRHATPRVRRIIAKDMAALGATIGTLSVFGYMLGNKDEWDWRSSDALKLRVGDSSIDLTPQLGQYATLLGQMATGEKKSTVTGKVTDVRDAWEPLVNFAENKITPPLSLAMELKLAIQGKKGRDFKEHTIPEVFGGAITPLSPRDVVQAMEAHGIPKGLAVSLAGLLGAGLNTYARDQKKRR